MVCLEDVPSNAKLRGKRGAAYIGGCVHACMHAMAVATQLLINLLFMDEAGAAGACLVHPAGVASAVAGAVGA
eukprot:353292-Chlamydomonas_euryale.AAC.2